MITTKFGGERNLKIGRPCLSLMGCIVTLTSTVFFRPTPGRVDPEDKDSEHIFTLYFNMTIYRVVILIHEEYELDLSRGEFVKLVGFKETVLKEKNNFVGKMVLDTTRSVGWVFLHCNLITRQANDVGSDVLSSFSTVNLQVSYPFKKVASCKQKSN